MNRFSIKLDAVTRSEWCGRQQPSDAKISTCEAIGLLLEQLGGKDELIMAVKRSHPIYCHADENVLDVLRTNIRLMNNLKCQHKPNYNAMRTHEEICVGHDKRPKKEAPDGTTRRDVDSGS